VNVAVIVPYGSGDPHRNAAAEIVQGYYACEFPTWRLAWHGSAHLGDAPFSRAEAINQAARHITAADLLVINDADSLCEPDRVREAVELAAAAPGLVRAYTSYRRLTREATEALRPAGYLDAFQGPFEWEMENAHAHGCVAVRRECFEQVGGYDPKFRGWGYEDLAAEMLYDAHWPDRRTPGLLAHLWHPPASDGPGVKENEQLYYERYEPNRGDTAALLAVRYADA
jgi:hypothetical protein